MNINNRMNKDIVNLLNVKSNYYKNKMVQHLRTFPFYLRPWINTVICDKNEYFIPSISDSNYTIPNSSK